MENYIQIGSSKIIKSGTVKCLSVVHLFLELKWSQNEGIIKVQF